MKEHSGNKILKYILRIFLLALCGAVIGFNIYSANANRLVGNQLPMPFGCGAAVVLSGSMEPELSVDDLIFVKESDSYGLWDVVVYQDGNSLVVHRIIECREDGFITKGDANNTDDGLIEFSRIKGKVVFAIPYVGMLVDFVKTPVGTFIIIVLAVLLLEIPRQREKKKDTEELEKIKEEIRKLKEEQ